MVWPKARRRPLKKGNQAVTQGEEHRVPDRTGKEVGVGKEGLCWTSGGGSLPSSTLKVVLEGRQGPLCWGGWCLVQWREHGPQTCGWAARGSLGTPGGGGCRERLLQGGRGNVKVQSELSA